MALIDVFADLKVWISLGFIAGLLFGSIGQVASSVMIIVLIMQMSVSLDGLTFRKEDMKSYRKPILWGIVCCFVVNSAITIFIGSMFIPTSTAIWYGWVMLASVPSAVSVVSASLYLNGDTKATVLMTSAIYISALAITPLISWALLGSAVSPLEVLRYIALFIAIPLVASQVLKRFSLPRRGKIVFINVMMFFLMFLALGSNRDYIISELDIVLWIILACFVKIFVLGIVATYILKKSAVSRDMGMIYILFTVWKNSGMAVSLSMVLLAGMTEAAVPCAISLIMETIWFTIFTTYSEKIWPKEKKGAVLSG
ncbi:MAG: Na+-dependent transporter [Methanomassiliicoccaceae archaeon]|nr:Na+-dependent transporter [Methanomassiliicoccaceae archaeon]